MRTSFIKPVIIASLFAVAIGLVQANWQAPTQAPPASTIDAPLNTGSVGQYKDGPLTISGILSVLQGIVAPASYPSGVSFWTNKKAVADDFCTISGTCLKAGGGGGGMALKTVCAHTINSTIFGWNSYQWTASDCIPKVLPVAGCVGVMKGHVNENGVDHVLVVSPGESGYSGTVEPETLVPMANGGFSTWIKGPAGSGPGHRTSVTAAYFCPSSGGGSSSGGGCKMLSGDITTPASNVGSNTEVIFSSPFINTPIVKIYWQNNTTGFNPPPRHIMEFIG